MKDALRELLGLSLKLRNRDTSLVESSCHIQQTFDILTARKDTSGQSAVKAEQRSSLGMFKDVDISEDEVLAVLEGMSSADEEFGKNLVEELLSLLQMNTKGTLPVILGFLESPQPASNIVVCGVRYHYDSTMDMVLSYFQPGVLPHHTLLNALGDISRNCSRDIARDIVRLLDLLVAVLPLAVTNKMKAMMAFALEGLYESWAKFQGPGQCVQDCSTQVMISFDVVHRWLPSSEPKVTAAIVLALAAMCCLLPEEKFQCELPAVLQAFQPLYAAELDVSYSRINKIDSNVLFFQSLSVLVEAAVSKARPVLESQLEQLLTMVHAHVMGTAARSPAQKDVTVVSKSDLAVLMGLCASVHLDVVLSVLKRLETQLTDPAFPCNEQGSGVGVLHQTLRILLQDPEPQVRERAAEAMGLFTRP
ncbi:MROH1 protein, partial [Atractosteus spatula]|nr:MROH1 protein [Atractosteus spatula]